MITIQSADAECRRRRIVEVREGFVAHRPDGVIDLVSGLESLLIEYDPVQTGPDELSQALSQLRDSTGTGAISPRRVFELPVVFGPETGPDLAVVAEELGLSSDALVEQLCAHDLSIVLLAAAMAPMMSGLCLPAQVARQSQPRTDVPAGSIMIAGVNAIIQPFPGPTGWRVVGRTPLTIVDIRQEPPVSFAPGDIVRLRAISPEDAAAMGGFLRESCDV